MTPPTPKKPGGSVTKTFLIGALILFGLALLVGLLSVLFP